MSSIARKIFFVFVSVRVKKFFDSISRRSARILICCSLSSPETYNTRNESNCRPTCNSSVDFPIPGSPPINTNDPGTIPPPNTRFNSESTALILTSSDVSISCSAFAFTVFNRDDSCRHSFLLFSSFTSTSSTNVFQDPHDGHFPSHLAASCPQD